MSEQWFADEHQPGGERSPDELNFRAVVRDWAEHAARGVPPDRSSTIWLPTGLVLGIGIPGLPGPSTLTFSCGYFPQAAAIRAQPSFDGYVLDGHSPWDIETLVADTTAAAATAIDWFARMLALPLEIRAWPGRARKHLLVVGDSPQRVYLSTLWWWPGQRQSPRLVRTKVR